MVFFRQRPKREPGLEDLLQRISSPSTDERAVAALLLAGFDDPRAERALEHALEDRKRLVRRSARDALDRLEERRAARPRGLDLRNAEPGDHARIVGAVDEWWGGRPMAAMLPRLFFVHFRETSFVVEDGGRLVGFLCGFLSQSAPDEAYVHFVGVHPERRGEGIGRELYERFFAIARGYGRRRVRCVTSPENAESRAFHRRLGFEEERVVEDYDAPGAARVLLVKRI